MKTPCDEAAIRAGIQEGPCADKAKPWILAATILGSSMAFIDSTVVNVAIPTLQNTFHANIVDVQWVVEAYALFLSALILTGGALGDLYGRRRVFLAGVGIFAASSAACGLAPTIEALIIARCVQGAGAALLVPGSLAIISASFDETSRGKAIGTWSGFTAITTALGPVLGGWLIQHASWRWAFFLNLPLAVAVIVISLRHISESRGGSVKHLDWGGTLPAMVGLGGVVNGFVESPNLGWGSPMVFASLGVGFACLVAFVWVEARERAPMLPLGLFRSRSFSGANLLTLFLYAALGIFFFLYPLELIQVRGYSATVAAAAALPVIVLLSSLSRWSGGLVDRYGPKTPLVAGPIIAGAGFALFLIVPARGSYWTTLFPAFVTLGLGLAVTVAPLTTVVMSSVDQDHVGTASGINNAVARVAGVLAIAVFGAVLVSSFSSRLNQEMATLPMPASVLHDIQANEIRLADIRIPNGLGEGTTTALRSAIARAFVGGFRLIMVLCAALAGAATIVAWRLIPAKIDRKA